MFSKIEEVKSIIPEFKQIDLDLSEIQELAPSKVILEKLNIARKMHKKEFICEDTPFILNV